MASQISPLYHLLKNLSLPPPKEEIKTADLYPSLIDLDKEPLLADEVILAEAAAHYELEGYCNLPKMTTIALVGSSPERRCHTPIFLSPTTLWDFRCSF
jgi:hypothetical protein